MDNLIEEIQNAKLTPAQNGALVTFVTHHVAPILNENELLKDMKIYLLEIEFEDSELYIRAKNRTDLAKKIIALANTRIEYAYIVSAAVDACYYIDTPSNYDKVRYGFTDPNSKNYIKELDEKKLVKIVKKAMRRGLDKIHVEKLKID